ncbi:putative uncharacterized protein DDB_G0289263 [Leptopilina heterotoma]|uniref:putative uncharacterized protein DDB_G0289263 n=1 Tax=Leptopilina heterotoma TaxID=63436 RepID=UPI001CA9ABBD|nr:putative uncharacterized protein DDB_G0289263 [Leptopilina heterotoma]XP_043484587.1 putative uncharacterized protein DDB_G0289263 [Leptopilina heterotoma]XP_043484596.1 putative uncharacterized protein DDB_G0289263 [Leptopilina heterotoma]
MEEIGKRKSRAQRRRERKRAERHRQMKEAEVQVLPSVAAPKRPTNDILPLMSLPQPSWLSNTNNNIYNNSNNGLLGSNPFALLENLQRSANNNMNIVPKSIGLEPWSRLLQSSHYMPMIVFPTQTPGPGYCNNNNKNHQTNSTHTPVTGVVRKAPKVKTEARRLRSRLRAMEHRRKKAAKKEAEEELSIVVKGETTLSENELSIVVQNETTNLNDSELSVVVKNETTNLNDSEMSIVVQNEKTNLNDSELSVVVKNETTNLNDSEMSIVVNSETTNLNDSEMSIVVNSETTNLNDSEMSIVVNSETTNLTDSELSVVVKNETTNLTDSEVSIVVKNEATTTLSDSEEKEKKKEEPLKLISKQVSKNKPSPIIKNPLWKPIQPKLEIRNDSDHVPIYHQLPYRVIDTNRCHVRVQVRLRNV